MDRHTLLRLTLEIVDRQSPLPATPEWLAGTGEMQMLRLGADEAGRNLRELEQRGYLRNLSNPMRPVYNGILPAAKDQLDQTATRLDPALWGDLARG